MNLDKARFALNPLQYMATDDGWLDPTLNPPLAERLQYIASVGFTAVQSDVPADQTTEAYGAALAAAGLQPGPGYVNLKWSDTPEVRHEQLRQAGDLAENNVALGTPLLFLSMGMERDALRVQHPARGYGSTPEHLARVRDYLREAAEIITAAGGVAALHPHVGTWIETAVETRYVLDSIDDKVLGFGPDIGHLAWTGADPAQIMAEYAGRIAGVHIKDLNAEIARTSREERWSYRQTVQEGIWKELGTGDLDYAPILSTLPEDFNGWIVIEVDRGTTSTPEESINMSAEWLKANTQGALP
ncbi:inosose dehydratase [Arthrobacter sp. 2762]